MGDDEIPLPDAGDSASDDNPVDPPDDAQADKPESAEIDMVDSWVGQYLADYYIIRRIGEGGMGIVYLARHQSLDRLAAVKFLASHMVNDKAYIERFLKEARGAAKLNHPNITSIYDAGSLGNDIYYFIMEYVEGRDIGSMLRERRVLAVPEAVGYIRQAAAALGYAHKKRIIHRDIKPDNLMLTNEGTIKVGDLGLAKWMGDEDAGGMTQTGVVMGTPFYISPEQVRGSRDVDSRSDIYSLGATLFHIVTGRIPYEGTSPAVIMAMHLNNPVPDPSQTNVSLDVEISAIIKKMMAKDVEQRFQNMEEVDNALADYQAGRMRSARFNPAVLAGLPPAQALPPTEPPIPPDAPPSRTYTSPTVVASESFMSTKTAFVLGASVVTAVLIYGVFMFLGKAVDYRKGNEALAAAQPVVKADKPAEAGSPKPAAKPEKGLVRKEPSLDLKIPTEVPTHPSDAFVFANFNDISDERLNRDFGMWTYKGGNGEANVSSGIGTSQSGAFRVQYDVSKPGSEWGVWGGLPPVPASEYRAIGLRLKSEAGPSQLVNFKVKWKDRSGEHTAGALIQDIGVEWKTVILLFGDLQLPSDGQLVGFDLFFRNSTAKPLQGTIVVDDVALLKSLPDGSAGGDPLARVEYQGHSGPLPQMADAVVTPSSPAPGTQRASFGPGENDSPFQPQPPPMGGAVQVFVVTPDGVLREMPPEMAQQMTGPLAAKRSFYVQDLHDGKTDRLPREIDCILFEPGARKVVQVGKSGFVDRGARCEAKWDVVDEKNIPGGKYLKLWHETAQPQWMLGAQVDLPSMRNKQMCLAFLVRGARPGTQLMVGTSPETIRMNPIPLDGQWKQIIVPMPVTRFNLKSILVGFHGTGELHIAEIRVDPMPNMIRQKMMERVPDHREPLGTRR